jgi:hypothetical protein
VKELLVDKMDAVGALIAERGRVYGHPQEDFERVAAMTAPLADCQDVVLRHVLYMIIVKICRLIVTPTHEDSWLDIVGYARTAAMVVDRRAAAPQRPQYRPEELDA